MNIYIGLDYNGKPTSVLLADNKEKAEIAWMGMNDIPHSIEEIDPVNDELGIHGVAFLLTSTERNTREIESNRSGFEGVDFRHFVRGRA